MRRRYATDVFLARSRIVDCGARDLCVLTAPWDTTKRMRFILKTSIRATSFYLSDKNGGVVLETSIK